MGTLAQVWICRGTTAGGAMVGYGSWALNLSLDSRALTNKSLVLVKYFICGKVLKLFYHQDL